MALVKQSDSDEMVIKPEAVTPAVDTSSWPLLLKNWDQRMLSSSRACEWHRLTFMPSPRTHRPLHTHPRRLHPSPP